MNSLATLLILALMAPSPALGDGAMDVPANDMVRVPGGSYLPLYAEGGERVTVAPFDMDRRPVTRTDYLEFVTKNPQWRRDQVKPIFADAGYLASWPADLDAGEEDAGRFRVTEVSWFAARAYCEAVGKRLPTTHEWEFAALASETERDAARDPVFMQRLMELATRRNAALQPLGSGVRNIYGIEDLHGLGWEWVSDFNSIISTDDSRAAGTHDRQLFCAAGGIKTTDPRNYPAFLRFAMRSGLQAATVVGNLGFRCARSI